MTMNSRTKSKPSMKENTRSQADHVASLDIPMAVEVAQHANQSIPKQNGSAPDFNPPFLALAKAFDTSTKEPSDYPTSFDPHGHSSPCEALSNRENQQKHPGYSELERPWASKWHGQLPHASDGLARNRNSNDTPLNRWRSGAPINEPYHAIGSVMVDQAALPARASNSTAGTERSETSEQGTWGSAGEHC